MPWPHDRLTLSGCANFELGWPFAGPTFSCSLRSCPEPRTSRCLSCQPWPIGCRPNERYLTPCAQLGLPENRPARPPPSTTREPSSAQPARGPSGENSRTKVQNVVVDSTDVIFGNDNIVAFPWVWRLYQGGSALARNGVFEGWIVHSLERGNTKGVAAWPRVHRVPGGPASAVNFSDIANVVDAFTGAVYPFEGPSECP